jgi:hypothetical protein
MYDTANSIGRAGAVAAPSKGARGRSKAGGNPSPTDRSQRSILGSMGKGTLQLRRTGAGAGRRGDSSGSSGNDWEPTGRKGSQKNGARRRASQRAAAAQQVDCHTRCWHELHEHLGCSIMHHRVCVLCNQVAQHILTGFCGMHADAWREC